MAKKDRATVDQQLKTAFRSEAAENSGLNVSVSHDSTSIGELNRIGC